MASLSGRKFLEESKLIPEHNICNIWFLHYFSLPLPASGDRLTWNVAKRTKTAFLSLFLHYVLNYKFWSWAAQYFSMCISIHFNMYLITHIQHVLFFFYIGLLNKWSWGIDCAVLVCTQNDTCKTWLFCSFFMTVIKWRA